jgi:hypothetical protein
MRTTLSIDSELLERAKNRAGEQGRTLGSYVEEALRTSLAAEPAAPRRVTLPSSGGGGVLPGIDLYSNAALYDILDEDGAIA